MRYGYFDETNREYVITDPRTPVKWINYIGTRDFGGFVDHTGGALICKDDPTFNRITKYIQQMPSSDFKGETLYLRLHPSEGCQHPSEGCRRETDGFRVFSPFFVPTLDEPERYECHVGLGYTRIITEFYGVRCEVTIFVPLGDVYPPLRGTCPPRRGGCELRDVRVTNLRAAPVEVDAVPVVEYTHPDALKQFTNADWVPQTMQSRAVDVDGCLVLLQYPFVNRDRQVNYLTANLPASSFESDRKRFLGANEYGSFREPLALLEPELSNTQAQRGDNIGALLVPLGRLAPGETRRLVTQLGQVPLLGGQVPLLGGQAPALEAALPAIRRYRDEAAVDAELARLRAFWDEYLAALQVETPDAAMNAMLNVYNPRQCYVTKTWSRYLSYYQLGMGSRGIGMRDSAQDVMAVLASVPGEAKDFLRTLLSFQRQDGAAMHQFNPLTLEGSVGDSAEAEDRPHYYSDDHLWCVLAVTAYLKETGDLDFLDEELPFYEKDKAGRPVERASLFEHLRRALAFTRGDVGAHGLPLLGYADWNDTVNLPKGAESLFTANLYGRVLLEMEALYRRLGREQDAAEARADYETMRARVEAVAWDAPSAQGSGAWYVRYFDAEGEPLGSARNTYGQIHLNGQSWPVISGFASPERARQAMDSAFERLNTRYGLKLSAPGFNGYDPHYGGVTTYPPGAKENGGIFVHPNPWAVIAEAILGRGERAFQYYAQINPALRNDDAERYEVEPYVYAQNVLGDEHPQFGLGRNSWLSGTASWSYQAATQYILGLRPEYDGLRIDPCIPAAWSGFSAVRRFRGKTLKITVHNAGVCKGVMKMTIDGKAMEGNLVPVGLEGEEHAIEVWMGRENA